jgi:hypothetical protein
MPKSFSASFIRIMALQNMIEFDLIERGRFWESGLKQSLIIKRFELAESASLIGSLGATGTTHACACLTPAATTTLLYSLLRSLAHASAALFASRLPRSTQSPAYRHFFASRAFTACNRHCFPHTAPDISPSDAIPASWFR